MKLIIAGCGRVGSELAQKVAGKGYDVNVIDIDPEAFHRLGPDFRGRTIQGDVRDRAILERADVQEADGFAAVTPRDDLNLVASQAVKSLYNVPNVVAHVYDPTHAHAFALAGVHAINPSSWGAQRMEQVLTHPGSVEIVSLGNGEVRVLEICIPPRLSGSSVADIVDRCTCIPTALIRGGKAMLLEPDTTVKQGDLLVVTLESAFLPSMDTLLKEQEN